MNELLGERIRSLRGIRKLTQEQMAEKLNMSRQRYARIENGVNNITLELLSRVAEILDVTVSDITNVLDTEPQVAHRGNDGASVEQVMDMLDFFYANKNMYQRLQPTSEE